MSQIHLSSEPFGPLRAIPPLPALLAFQRAAAQLSFRRAARDLALSPSAVSHQIRGLEERFGVRLFARGGRAVKLTPDGERYFEAVSGALAMLEDASRDLLREARGGQGELRISSMPFFTSAVLIPALPSFKRDHPGMTLHIEATHQYADFDRSGVDVAIRYGRERTAGLKLEPLVDVGSLPVCAPQLRRSLRAPPDLAKATLIHVSAQPRAWPAWFSDIGAADVTPAAHLWFDSVPAALEAAEQGLGVALAMNPLIRGRRGFGRTLIAPFDLPAPHMQTLYVVTRTEQAKDRRIVACKRWLTAAVKQASA